MKRLLIGLLFTVSMGSLAMDKEQAKQGTDSFFPDSFTINAIIFVSYQQCRDGCEHRSNLEKDTVPYLAKKLLNRVKKHCQIFEAPDYRFKKNKKCEKTLGRIFKLVKFLKNSEQDGFLQSLGDKHMKRLERKIENGSIARIGFLAR